MLETSHLDGLSRSSWSYRRADFRWRLDNCPVEEFATWPVSLETIYTGRSPQVENALEILKRWESWGEVRAVMKEPAYMPEFRLLPGASGTMIHQAMHMYFLEQFSDGIGVEPRIVEFGGGYGAMARMMTGFPAFHGSYIIYDFPELLEIQEFYLGDSDVWLTDDLEDVGEADVVFAFNSLGEAPYAARDAFLEAAKPRQLLVLYSEGYDSIVEGVYKNGAYFTGWAMDNGYEYHTRPSPVEVGQVYFYARRHDEVL